MKRIILAEGVGTWFRALTTVINKHLLSVGSYSMLYSMADKKLREAEITDVLLLINKADLEMFSETLGNG
ncbi:sugar phosphate nucleotidyltransferase [Priestia aryabhattai]|uniref:sugar phosphate nucleotidyltransferase n=1 Tax=Priestia TaxID=2800373 RepID=UPI001C8D76BB|nr:sugar phosphate nucleotidyltransferase [Priestia aryabhattai]MBY0074710.1 hypothetical protein [Priestia aryabhattai]